MTAYTKENDVTTIFGKVIDVVTNYIKTGLGLFVWVTEDELFNWVTEDGLYNWGTENSDTNYTDVSDVTTAYTKQGDATTVYTKQVDA